MAPNQHQPSRAGGGPTLEVLLDPRALARQLDGVYFCDGRFERPAGGSTYALHSPATQELVANVAACSHDEVDRVVRTAARAQRDWARLGAAERAATVLRAAATLEAHKEELARLVALETGKALRTECRGEAMAAGLMFAHYAGLASELKGETLPPRPDMMAITRREPVGVVAAILPWNAPVALAAVKSAPALVAGNAVIIKAAEEAPLAVLRLVQLMNQVLPAGVLNVLCGDGVTTGDPLVKHPLVNKITFTGSVETGRVIARNAADKLVPVTLELGGKSPMIVMPDADLDKAVEGALIGMRFTRQGQSCSACSRIFVHARLLEAFVDKLKARVDTLKMGDPLDEETDIGTIVSQAQFDKVRQYIELGQAMPGVRAVFCSQLPASDRLAAGFYVRPVLFVGVDNASRIAREEIFGPVTCIIPFTEYEEALRQANDSDYGLVATIWTRDLHTALDAANRLDAGYVQINQSVVAGLGPPYGGFKNSGLGKELSLRAMLDHFTREKTILINMVK